MAFLQVMSGLMTGHRIDIAQADITIGRSPDNVLSLDDPAVSGRHCVVIRQGDTYVLRDEGSTNGTLVNGTVATEQALAPKDVVTVGSAEILFDGEGIESAASHPVAPAASVPERQAAGPRTATVATVGPSPFSTRRDTKWAWIAAMTLVGVAILAALAWFVLTLLRAP